MKKTCKYFVLSCIIVFPSTNYEPMRKMIVIALNYWGLKIDDESGATRIEGGVIGIESDITRIRKWDY